MEGGGAAVVDDGEDAGGDRRVEEEGRGGGCEPGGDADAGGVCVQQRMQGILVGIRAGFGVGVGLRELALPQYLDASHVIEQDSDPLRHCRDVLYIIILSETPLPMCPHLHQHCTSFRPLQPARELRVLLSDGLRRQHHRPTRLDIFRHNIKWEIELGQAGREAGEGSGGVDKIWERGVLQAEGFLAEFVEVRAMGAEGEEAEHLKCQVDVLGDMRPGDGEGEASADAVGSVRLGELVPWSRRGADKGYFHNMPIHG